MTLQSPTPLVSALIVMVIIAIGVWIVLAIVDDRKLRIILCIAWVVIAVLAAFGLLR